MRANRATPPAEPPFDRDGWAARLQVSRDYYRALIANPAAAREAFLSDFGVFKDLLAECDGRVLDIGGGNGLVRAFLPDSARYVSLDPDASWRDLEWDVLRDDFPCLTRPLTFVRGVGEHVPFGDKTFDAALVLFSLNHCAEPARAVAEIARVVGSGGRVVMALEDVEPSWRDVWRGAYVDWRGWTTTRIAIEKIKAHVHGWPLERDHIRITERALDAWMRGRFQVRDRQWRGSYLTLDLRRS